MAMDDLPRPGQSDYRPRWHSSEPRNVPEGIRQFSLIDKVDCQERYISMTLNLGIDHVVPWTEASFSSSAPAATAFASSPSTRLSVKGSKYVTSGLGGRGNPEGLT